jgi:hypothetical protein
MTKRGEIKPKVLKWLELYNLGASYRDIQKIYGVSHQTIRQSLLRIPEFVPRSPPKVAENAVTYRGLVYSLSCLGWYRCTSGDRHGLARKIWTDHYGDPGDCEVVCKKLGSTNIEDYELVDSKERGRRLSFKYKMNCYKGRPLGTVSRWYGLRDYVKTKSGWMQIGRAEWIAKNGPVPEGMVIYKGELMDRETATSMIVNRYPMELLDTVSLLQKVRKTIRKKEKKNGKNQNQ